MRYSIITCTYNASAYIINYLNRICEINYYDFELVVVDDASSDNTYDLLMEHSKTMNMDVNIIRHENNAGPGVARNTAIQNSSGDKILFVDADDEVDREIFNILDEVGNYDIIFFDYCKKYSSNLLKRCNSLLLDEGSNDDIERLLATTTGSVWGKLFDSRIIRDSNIEFPAIYTSEDFVFMVSYLSQCTNSYYYKQPLYYYTISSGSLMHRNIDKQINNVSKAIEIINQLNLTDKLKNLYYCREYVYDTTNAYMLSNQKKDVVLSFWSHNPLPDEWIDLSGYLRKWHYLALLLIRHKCYYCLYILMKVKKIFS